MPSSALSWSPARRLYFLLLGLTALVSLALYAPHLSTPLYRLDDLPQARLGLRSSLAVRDVFRMDYAGFFRPGTRLLWILTARGFGMDPTGHRWLAHLLHAAICLMLALVALELTRSHALSVVTGLTYAVSYPHYNGVTWVSAAYTELTSTLLCLTALWLYLRGWERQRPGEVAVGALAYGAALLFKETAAGWVLALAVADRYRLGAGTLRRLWPYALLALGAVAFQAGITLSGAAEGTWRAKEHRLSPLNGLGLFVALRQLVFLPLLDTGCPIHRLLGRVPAWLNLASYPLAVLLVWGIWRVGGVSRFAVNALVAVLLLPVAAGVKFGNSRALVMPSVFLALACAGLLHWAWKSRWRWVAMALYLVFLGLNAGCVTARLLQARPSAPRRATTEPVRGVAGILAPERWAEKLERLTDAELGQTSLRRAPECWLGERAEGLTPGVPRYHQEAEPL